MFLDSRRFSVRLPAIRRIFGATASLAVVLLGFATPAHATGGTRLALDVDFAGPIDEAGVDGGTGGAIRIGRKLDLLVVSLTPELGGSYHTFSGGADATLYSGFLGGRLSFGKVIEPGVFAHVGLGRLNAYDAGDTGPALDAGIFLDLTVIPIVDLGVHAAYDVLLLDDDRSFDWYRLGVHAALAF